jgi:MYXO-CTERM domain-containing protein
MRLWAVALALATSGAALALPQSGRPRVLRAERHDVSPPLWLIRPAEPVPGDEGEDHEPGRVPLEALEQPARDPVLQSSPRPLLSVPVASSFAGIGLGFVGNPPGSPFDTSEANVPDPQGDVGPNHYVQIVNSSFAVFSKTGAVLYGPVPTQTLFSKLGGVCESGKGGDGIVLYDSLADRWLVATAALSANRSVGPYYECVAVSQSPDPTGAYNRYAYAFGSFNDYPKFGVWPDAYYATFNLFQDGNDGAPMTDRTMCAVDRTRMLQGADAPMQCIDVGLDGISGMTPADFDGQLPPPPGEPGFIVGFTRLDTLVLYRFHVDWEAPERTTLDAMSIPVAPFGRPCARTRSGACIPQVGSGTSGLDALSDRMMFRVAYRNFGAYASIVANHTVTGASADSSGVRWYEIRDPAGDPVAVQQGTYAPDSNWRWLGSAAMDRAGNIGLGFSISSPQMHPSIGVTGHATTDPAGVMGQGETIFGGGGSQSTLSMRWGDYSSMSVDPVDDCTFWYTNQYLPFDGAFNWRTQIMTFQLPGCTTAPDFAVWLVPARQTVALSGTATVTVGTASLHGAAASTPLQLSLAGPPGMTAIITPSVVLPGQSATINLAADANAAIGEVPFTVQAARAGGPALSAAGTAAVIDSDFEVVVDKPATAVGEGGRTDVRVSTHPLFGPSEVLLFSVPHMPRGISATIDPPYARVGETVLLRLSGDAINLAGTGTVRVQAAGRLAVRSATIAVRSLVLPTVHLLLPLARANVSGTIPVSAVAVASLGTSLASMELMVDGSRMGAFDSQAIATKSPTFLWDTNSVNDGPHLIAVRASDADGNSGQSAAVALWVQNKNECGCSSDGGAWEAIGLAALLAAARRRRRVTGASAAG